MRDSSAASARATRWNREHPERRREIANRYARRPEVARHQAAACTRRRRQRRAAERRAGKAEVYRCAECGAAWCPAPWARGLAGRGEFCGDACRQRHRYQARTPGARRVRRQAGRPTGSEPQAPPVVCGAVPIGSTYVPRPAPRPVPEPLPVPAQLEPLGEEPELPEPERRATKGDRAVRLAELRGEVDAQALRDELELTQDAANQLLRRLAAAGRLERAELGRYIPARGA